MQPLTIVFLASLRLPTTDGPILAFASLSNAAELGNRVQAIRASCAIQGEPSFPRKAREYGRLMLRALVQGRPSMAPTNRDELIETMVSEAQAAEQESRKF